MSDRDDLVQAAIAWYRSCGPYGPAGPYSDEMSHLLGAIERVASPEPEERERPWSQIPARWEVQAPDGRWYRIISNVQRDGQQYVYLDMGNGEGREWPRDPADRVTCRPPADPDATDRALAAFGDGFEIMEDQIS